MAPLRIVQHLLFFKVLVNGMGSFDDGSVLFSRVPPRETCAGPSRAAPVLDYGDRLDKCGNANGKTMITRRSFLAITSASLMGGEVPALADTSQQRFKPAPADFLTFHPQYVNTFKSPSPGLTFSSLYNLESSPAWIRLVYRNDMRDGETIDGAAIAPTAVAGDGFTAFNAEGKPD